MHDEDIARQRWGADNHHALSCHGKVKYDSAAEAGRAKQALKKKHRSRGELNIYRCENCGGWHMGRPMKRRRVKRRRAPTYSGAPRNI